jgi:hypothetical protein
MKFWTSEDDVRRFSEARKSKFATGPDHELYLHLGFFINAYAFVELRTTLLLAKVTGFTDDLQSFDLLTRGMDLRTKIIRLRKACERKSPLGPNLDARLTIVDELMRPIRNKIAHNYAVPDPSETTIHFVTLAAIPEFTEHRHPDASVPEKIETLELFEYTAWLRLFSRDLQDAFRLLSQTGTLEIVTPRTPLRQEPNLAPGQPKRASKPGRRARKRARKGQPPRGKVASE